MMFDKKNILLAPVRFIDSILDRASAVLGAIIFAQVPQFITHYIQRLGGHVDEAARGMAKYREIADDIGKSLEQYVQHLLNSRDPAIFKSGQKIAADLERYNHLANALRDLTSAPLYKKFFMFVRNIDLEIARGTAGNFTPGIPLTPEALAYALAGIVVGMAAYFFLSRLIILAVRKIAMRKKTVPPPFPASQA